MKAEEAYDSFLQLSKERKTEVGRRLSESCNKKVSSMVNFIKDQQVVLLQDLKNLDDVRLAMKCLDAIKDDSIEYVFRNKFALFSIKKKLRIRIDMLIIKMVETYSVFDEFSIEVPKEIKNAIIDLRKKFDEMMTLVN